MATNLGRWAPWYADADEQTAYTVTGETSYLAAAKWLNGLPVEDWGCGFGWYKRLHAGPYLGVDGTPSRWCDLVADLVTYRSDTPGLLMRHVLEHEPGWRAVLDNAVNSFTERMCLIVFTPFAEQTHVIADNVGGLGVPDISFAMADLTDRLAGCTWTVEQIPTATAYGLETIFRVKKAGACD